MIKNVLIVDDDKEMRQALRKGFKRYEESFAVFLAEDGLKALDNLKANAISLVVTDLKMPQMDGFELLAHIMEHYPDIPVIMITGYSTPEMELLARQGGAVGYISKPFLIKDLARLIMNTLREESEGGTLHNVSSGMFLQLIEMEQKTCTIRMEDKSTGEKGILFFSEGELLDARVNNLKGEPAAHKIFSWDAVNLSIQNGCALTENRIRKELQPLILEAARQKDEKGDDEPPAGFLEDEPPVSATSSSEPLTHIKDKIEQELGPSCGLEDIYLDEAWDRHVKEFTKMGEKLSFGKLILGYVDKGQATDYILLPRESTTVIAVDPKCPRDKLISLLNE